LEASEDAKAKQKRLSRLRDAESGRSPPKSAAVYLWEDEENDGFYVRRRLARHEIQFYWDNHAPEQRVYDSFHHQWDLCAPLQPYAVVENWDEGSEYDFPANDDDAWPTYNGAEQLTPFPNLGPDVDAALHAGSALKTIEAHTEKASEDSSVGAPTKETSMSETLRICYGFVGCNDDGSNGAHGGTALMRERQFRNALGDHK
jgi:hypothetical protein